MGKPKRAAGQLGTLAPSRSALKGKRGYFR
jgi:hypothetical protein